MVFSSRSPARFAAPGVLLLASLALFGGGLLPGQSFFYRDVLHLYWPMQATHLQLGLVPQWTPFFQGGQPFLANIHAGVLYPPNLLFALFSFPTAYALLLVVHHFVAQLGLFVFLRRKGLEDVPALVGALAFGLTGYVAGLSIAGPLMLGLAWMPWLLVVLHTPWHPLRRLALLAVLIATQLLSGDPQSALYSALVAAASVAWFPERQERLVALAGGGALGLLLAGLQVFPTLHLLFESTRGGDTPGLLSHWSLHPLRLIEFLLPYPFGEYLGEPETGRLQFWAWFMVKGPSSIPFSLSVYLGVTVLALAVLGARRDRLTGFALTLCAAGLLLALGQRSPLSFLGALPPFRLFRYPEKYVVLVALGCALLAASGARALLSHPSRRRLLGPAAALGLMLGALLWLWAVPAPAVSAATALFESLQLRRDPRDAVTSATHALATSGVFLAALLGLAVLSLRRPGSRALVAPALVVLVAGDLLWTARSTVWLGPTELFLEPPAVTRVKSLVEAAPTRLFRMDKPLKAAAPPSRSRAGLVDLRLFEAKTLKSNLAGVHGLEEVSSYGPVELWRWRALMDAFADQPRRMAELYSGCLLLTSSKAGASELEGTQPVLSEPSGLRVVRLTDCPARLRTVTRTVSVAGADEALAMLKSGGADGVHTVPVEGGETKTYAPARVDAVHLGPASARARVEAAAGGTFLVLATNFYPGWTASVDGQEQPLLAVDGALMGVEVAEGAHQVEFTFTDPGFVSGLQASLAGLLVLGLLLVRSRATAPRV